MPKQRVNPAAPTRSRTADVSRLPVIGLCLGLAALILWAYWPLRTNDFVNYDDTDYVTSNFKVQAGLTLQTLGWAFSSGHASNWHPLTWVSHMLDWSLFGEWAGGHHLTSLALHVANTSLLFLFFWRATRSLWRSFIVAGLFGLHPLHVESVAWVSERKDVLSTFFFLLTLLAYLRFTNVGRLTNSASGGPAVAEPTAAPRRGWPWYSLALLLFALGLMSKPMLVTLPFVLLLLDYWPLQRLHLGAEKGQLFKLALEKLPFFVLSAASCVVTFFVQQHGGSVSRSIELSDRMGNALISYARYLGKALWPVELSVLYPHPGQWPVWSVIGAAVLLAAITVAVLLAVQRWRDGRCMAVGWFWFVGTLVPVIGLVQVGIQSMADRYMYIPLTGLSLMMVWGLGQVAGAKPVPAKLLVGFGLVILLTCAWGTRAQVRHWANSETLFQRAVQVTRGNYLAYNNLGFHASKLGKSAEALQYFQRSLEINPDYEDALNNMGHALAGQGRYADALPYYERALKVRPDHPEVLNNYGNALSELGRVSEGIDLYRATLRINPEHADAHNNLGVALAMQGNIDQAIHHFQESLRFRPDYASAHGNLGNAYAVQNRLQEAIHEYQKCLRLKPDDAQAHNNLGNALTRLGKSAEAENEYREALRLNPINPEAHYNLSLLLLAQGRAEEATTHLREALRLRPNYPDARRQLQSLQSPR